MLQFLPVIDNDIIAVRASGKLTHEDYENFLPQLEAQLNTFKNVSILFELDNFSGWELEAAKDDMKFGIEHYTDFDRLAIVGDKAWEHWMVLIAKPFLLSSEIRYFDRENLQEAWDWLREKQVIETIADQLSPYKEIVVAVDFSPQSRHAVKRALELASYYQANLTLLNITQEALLFPYYYKDNMISYPYDIELLDKQNKQHIALAKEQMEAFVENFQSDIEIKTEVLIGDTGTTILSYLEAQKSDLVVFGATRKKGLSKLLGSIPRYIQNHARCEFLLVPLQRTSISNKDK